MLSIFKMWPNLPQDSIPEGWYKGKKYSSLNFTMGLQTRELGTPSRYQENNIKKKLVT